MHFNRICYEISTGLWFLRYERFLIRGMHASAPDSFLRKVDCIVDLYDSIFYIIISFQEMTTKL